MPIGWLIRDLVRVGAPLVFSFGLLWGMRSGYALMGSGGDYDEQRAALQDIQNAAWTCLLAGLAWGLGGFLVVVLIAGVLSLFARIFRENGLMPAAARLPLLGLVVA